MIGIAFDQIPVNAIERLPGDLGSPGIVKEDCRTIQGGNWLRIWERSSVIGYTPKKKWVTGVDYSPSPILEFGSKGSLFYLFDDQANRETEGVLMDFLSLN